jgi:HAD superfamily hydrolase (TIGR01549 family)
MSAIIFDFDGTLADSFDYVADYLSGEAGMQHLTLEQKAGLRHLSVFGMVRKLGFRWWQWPRLFYHGRSRMHHAMKDLDSFHGMPQLIQKLHGEGHTLYIVSNNTSRNVKLFLHHQHLQKYFVQIYGNVGIFGKAAVLRQLLRAQKLKREEAVYVGDEIRDVEAAKAIGMRTIAVSWGFASRRLLKAAKPTQLVDTPAELMRILEEI